MMNNEAEKKDGCRIMGNKSTCSSHSQETEDGSGNRVKGGGSQFQTDRKSKCRKSHNDVSDKTRETDRISKLTDGVLITILTLLPMKDAVRSSILSERWQNLWKSVQTIEFRRDESITDSQFIENINQYIDRYDGSKIKKLSIHYSFTHDKYHYSHIHKWVDFALVRNVEDLQLEFKVAYWGQFYTLPQGIYANTSLVSLKLTYCLWDGDAVIKWKWLKSISLDDVPMGDVHISKILLACPLLEVMELCHFCFIRDLKINSTRLQRLKLNTFGLIHEPGYEYEDANDFLLTILAPHLKSLEISGDLEMMTCKLDNVDSLEEADLIFHLSYTDYYTEYEEICQEMLFDLVRSLKHVISLKIGAWCIWILSALESSPLPPLKLNCRSLTLYTEIARWDLPGIVRLLRSSPYLETLVIDMDMPVDYKIGFFQSTESLRSYEFDQEKYFMAVESSGYLLQSLKNVQIINFGKQFYDIEQGGNREMTFELELVKFLLKNAGMLENIDIKLPRRRCKNCSRSCVPLGLFEMVTTKLSSFAASCSDARVNVL